MVKAIEVRTRKSEVGSQKLEVRGQKSEVRSQRSEVLRRLSSVLCWLAMLIFTFHACTHMVAAGDTWVAMACGRHFVNRGKVDNNPLPFRVDTIEPFSANSHKAGPTEEEIQTWPNWAQWITNKVGIETVKYWHPTGWVNQNWLTHVIFYSLIPQSSYADGVSFPSNALVYWKFAIYILTVICVYYTGRLLGVNPALCAVFSCFAMFTGRSFLDIRPAGFSNMLVAVFLLILVLTTYRNVLYIWLVVPVTVFWCNVHGGYIYAFIMLVPFFVLHLLQILPRKWTVSAGSILLWVGLYAFAYKFCVGLHKMILEFSSQYSFAPVPFYADKLFYLIVILSIASVLIAAIKRVKQGTFYGYHIAASVIVMLALLIARFFPKISIRLAIQQRDALSRYIISNQLTFLAIFAILTVLIIVMAFLKEKLALISLKGICHTAVVGIVALIASIVFNPFHLTNLTHTFVISVSEHAERWRNIHEWWSAFDWNNLVGTGFPFLVLYILSIGLLVLWLFSRFLKPKFLKAPKNELEAQRRLFTTLLTIFRSAAVILIAWVVFVSFSFLNLDSGSFLICALFVGILLFSTFKSIYFICFIVLLTLLALWSADANSGYIGRYIFPFVILPAYVVLNIVASLFSKDIKFKPKNIALVTLAAVASLLLMAIIFNPFGFKNPVWNVEQFFNLQRMWRPQYEQNLELSYTHLFGTLYFVNIASIIIWLAVPYLREVFTQVPNKTDEQLGTEIYQLPKIDLTVLAIAALTIYMAIRSRRFIPIAAIAACPIMAMFIDHMARTISAARNFHKHNRLTVSPMPYNLKLFFTLAGAGAVLFLGTWWGLEFKRIYLDSWPRDPKLTSMFMRMTDSGQKPFYATKFIKDNKLQGNMLNYWTEGGFIAFGQEPDPNTGRTPLQLFMDGRAQAAYNREAFEEWSTIMAGGLITGQIAARAEARRQSVTGDDYVKIGQWMDEQLKDHNVWVVLMPQGEYRTPPPQKYYRKMSYHAIQSIERNPNWPLVFLNNKQKLFVDIRTPQGKALYDGIFNGETVYPDDYHRNLIRAHSYNWLYYRRGIANKTEKKQGFDFAVKAFKLNPSPAPMQEIMLAASMFAEIKPDVNKFCENYVREFTENEADWTELDGYRDRVEAARLACIYLGDVARTQRNTKLVESYAAQETKCLGELLRVAQSKRW